MASGGVALRALSAPPGTLYVCVPAAPCRCQTVRPLPAPLYVFVPLGVSLIIMVQRMFRSALSRST
jgi:hypothetical protein